MEYCWCFQYESPKTIYVLENASVAQNVSYITACNPDTESTIYYYLIGLIRPHILAMLLSIRAVYCRKQKGLFLVETRCSFQTVRP